MRRKLFGKHCIFPIAFFFDYLILQADNQNSVAECSKAQTSSIDLIDLQILTLRI
jgi:hypothetical protein